jgi:SpoVK/Ycf46/Vps4 family AAA+-type ATPase
MAAGSKQEGGAPSQQTLAAHASGSAASVRRLRVQPHAEAARGAAVALAGKECESPPSCLVLLAQPDFQALGLREGGLACVFRAASESGLARLQPAFVGVACSDSAAPGHLLAPEALLSGWAAAEGTTLHIRPASPEESNQLRKSSSIKLHPQAKGSQGSDGPTEAAETVKRFAWASAARREKNPSSQAAAKDLALAWLAARRMDMGNNDVPLCQGTQMVVNGASFIITVEASMGAGAVVAKENAEGLSFDFGPPRPLRKQVQQKEEDLEPKAAESSKSLLKLPEIAHRLEHETKRLVNAFSMNRERAQQQPQKPAPQLPRPGGILVVGGKESGRTAFAQAVMDELKRNVGSLAVNVQMSCPALYKREPQQAREAMIQGVSDAIARAPAAVFFDDIDSLCAEQQQQQQQSIQHPEEGDSGAAMHAHDLVSMMDMCNAEKNWRTRPVVYIATAKSSDSLPKALTASLRFQRTVELPSVPVEQCGILLEREAARRGLKLAGVEESTTKQLEGFTAPDVRHAVDRAVHASASRLLGQKAPSLTEQDVREGVKGVLPAGVRSLGASQNRNNAEKAGWALVGGMQQVRDSLSEQLELPTKHAHVFKGAPIRLPTGAMLYGPPGSGKTLAAKAAAHSANLRLVSIKGPELLNKYIGASEASVRSLFQRARAAAPCVLFFDEFDAIAPRRGNDNTGVTDRVVNQLLTELDGVESLAGVYVLAATSRPDLIDSALLRPGRLDRMLYCGFPTEKDRMEVLQALASGANLANDVNLQQVASQTNGMSGADLKGLLTDAQLAALEELGSSDQDSDELPPVKQKHIDKALSNARISLSPSERQQLEVIYNDFQATRSSGGFDKTWSEAHARMGTKSALY